MTYLGSNVESVEVTEEAVMGMSTPTFSYAQVLTSFALSEIHIFVARRGQIGAPKDQRADPLALTGGSTDHMAIFS